MEHTIRLISIFCIVTCLHIQCAGIKDTTIEMPNKPVEIKNPNAVSSAHGRIERVLLALPKYGEDTQHVWDLLADLSRKLPHYTKLELLVYDNEATQKAVENTLKQEVVDYFFYDENIGDKQHLTELRNTKRCCIIKNPNYHNFSIWVQDPFLVVADEEYNSSGLILIEPEEGLKGTDDDEIADHFEKLDIYRAENAPLSFHGGNVLVADDFILVGANHFNSTKKIVAKELKRVEDCKTLDERTRNHFARYLGRDMKIIPVGNTKYHHCKIDGEIQKGRGVVKEPFTHIDMYISPAGRDENGQYQLVIGDPIAMNVDDESAVQSLKGLMEPVVENLTSQGFKIIRNPMPLNNVSGNSYYCYYNNSLIEIDENSKRIWIPTFGHGDWKESLRRYDIQNREIWRDLGFEVIELMDFHPFVRQKAGVRCVTKFMGRFNIYDIHSE